jgi:hypothetical protein
MQIAPGQDFLTRFVCGLCAGVRQDAGGEKDGRSRPTIAQGRGRGYVSHLRANGKLAEIEAIKAEKEFFYLQQRLALKKVSPH